MIDLSNFQPYIILPDGTEIAGTLTLWISEARREADQLQGQYPTARVTVVNFHNQVVYTAVPTPATTTVHISLDHLLTSVDVARTSTTEKRWLNAIDSAYEWLMEQESVTLDADGSVLVESATEPGKIYVANGSCQCVAYIGGNPCWHRAAARLVRRMLEAVEQEEQRARQVKALGARMAERRRVYDEVDALFV